MQTISTHETGHVAFLTAALNAAGSAPTEECTYAFGITSVAQFVATASVLEGVGTSAYLGAAAQIATKVYLTAAGSILTIEARHSSYLRASLAESPFPQAYDDPLTPDEVHTLAHGFIVSCPADNPTFPVKAFPGLTVTTTGTITSGMTIGVQTAGYALAAADANAHIYAAFVTVTGPDWALLQPAGDGKSYQVTVPQGVNGQSYLLFTNCNETVNDNTVVAGPTIVEVSRWCTSALHKTMLTSSRSRTLRSRLRRPTLLHLEKLTCCTPHFRVHALAPISSQSHTSPSALEYRNLYHQRLQRVLHRAVGISRPQDLACMCKDNQSRRPLQQNTPGVRIGRDCSPPLHNDN